MRETTEQRTFCCIDKISIAYVGVTMESECWTDKLMGNKYL